MFMRLNSLSSTFKYINISKNLVITNDYLFGFQFTNNFTDAKGVVTATAVGAPTNNGNLVLSRASSQYLSLSSFTSTASTSIYFQLKRTAATPSTIENIFSMSATNGYHFSLGIQNNNLYYRVNNTDVTLNNPLQGLNTGSGVAAASAFGSNYPTDSSGGDIAVSYDGMTIIYCGGTSTTGRKQYWSKNGGTTWTASSSTLINMSAIAITADGTRYVVGQSPGNLHYGDCSTATPTNTTRITNLDRNYNGISMTADGNRMVASAGGNTIFLFSWNGTKYDTPPIDITYSGTTISAVALTPDGYRMAFSSGTTIYLTNWTGTTYTTPAPASISAGTNMSNPTNLKFSLDGLILYADMSNNTTSGLYYSYINSSTGTYSQFNTVSSSILTANKEYVGLSVDGSGNIYMGVNKVAAANAFFKINPYTASSNYYINSNLTSISDTLLHEYALVMNTNGNIELFVDNVSTKKFIGVAPAAATRGNNYIGNDQILFNSYPSVTLDNVYFYNKLLI